MTPCVNLAAHEFNAHVWGYEKDQNEEKQAESAPRQWLCRPALDFAYFAQKLPYLRWRNSFISGSSGCLQIMSRRARSAASGRQMAEKKRTATGLRKRMGCKSNALRLVLNKNLNLNAIGPGAKWASAEVRP